MELVNEFRVPVAPDEAWKVLTDVERVAPCIPGARLLGVNGDEFTGAVKVKVGPITVSYQGEASFAEKDEAARRVVIKANGKETRGSGTAAAVVTAQLKDEGSAGAPATGVVITTDLTISGKAAQFGRGVLADVAANLIGQFAERLEADVLGVSSTGSTTPAGDGSAATAAAQTGAAAGDESVDLLKVMAVPMAKRFAPVAAGVAAGLLVGLLLGRRRRRPASVSEELQAALARLLS
ncbi:carbon monoxide dehydrogenase subunit G family protein [Mycolicibacterium hassiacum DSM 44199]|uniref:Carbon monoxide dehydrogenase subunit G family protein n=1 Tax=Mycolicibacterium hassiacum (strain DSM 44199 / CIP 105218 / JCM 12690 / 3849) TaxID=1122247 RepID=K5BJ10_MYCHD|nr:SRPBCC family protein [Mycolicibacterium hassiacum]EKF22299.1 carbon monoxide dehydrogenase subunit G family protein [Mycolicibacterium hassiacum DSM 44199]MBX5485325.1 SRPBCC family protein [Mycolicibacterium hassiacum]MDA4087428.1 carbon monoxide dehydrogenase subunit G [Mycolicibacterium hassiacum DSM 44199]PZN22383.1 MAG: carbon monoxide dehydrogenase [Mycolicibacterium hassiacum]VCT91947.1 hypothetical protein MHAS_03671 [Mycolicibacterium hassiacum DSM 44199]